MAAKGLRPLDDLWRWGYSVNTGSGNKDYWFAGWLLQRKVTDRLALGCELFYKTTSTIDGVDRTGFNLGGVFEFSPQHHLLLSAGPGIQNTSKNNTFAYYLGYQPIHRLMDSEEAPSPFRDAPAAVAMLGDELNRVRRALVQADTEASERGSPQASNTDESIHGHALQTARLGPPSGAKSSRIISVETFVRDCAPRRAGVEGQVDEGLR